MSEPSGASDGGVRAEDIADAVWRAALPSLAPRIPRATYRLQLSSALTFADAAALLDYLDALGISDLYLSPCFRARPDSPHGYDVVDHSEFNCAIGTREDFERLTDRLAGHGMGLLLDTVPNHMGIASGNPWWHDVLENGPSSLYAAFFDIAWKPLQPALDHRVLLPVLGDHYGRVLERGELRVEREGGAFSARYCEHLFPLSPRTYHLILDPLLPELARHLGDEHDTVLELQSILTGLFHLPPRGETRRARMVERHREKEILKRRLVALLDASPLFARLLHLRLEGLNGHPGDPHSFDGIDALLEAQPWRLAYFRVAAEEINYRRFFDINDLVALRMENPAVFAAAHRLLFEILGEGRVTGLRIDHIDGLWDPAAYLHKLQEGAAVERFRRAFLALRGYEAQARLDELRGGREDLETFEQVLPVLRARWRESACSAPLSPLARPLFVVVEKILARGEHLPDGLACAGTVGYEFGALVDALLTDPAGEPRLGAVYQRIAPDIPRFDLLGYEKKKLVLQSSLASELSVLAHTLDGLAESNRHFRDFTLGTLAHALVEVIAWFPTYRTYVGADEEPVSVRDRQGIERAVRLARRRSPTTDPSVFTFVKSVLTLDLPELNAADRGRARDFVMKFQQLTGPVMAKGVEDTAFYLYHRLTSLNEVGGAPDRFGASAGEFHEANEERLRHAPHQLLALSTHDSKRSEDVRARVGVLAQIPSEWEQALTHLREAVAGARTEIEGEPAPGPNEEYLFHQTVLGTFPVPAPDEEGLCAYTERIALYMAKAMKEAKQRTSWINPDQEYDGAVERFVKATLAPGSRYLEALQPILAPVAYHGMWSSLSARLLALTVPGVPDLYQGSELWELRLVDPDNRHPIDYRLRRRLLQELRARRGEPAALARELVAGAADGRIKLYITMVALTLRRAMPELFANGDYRPLRAEGAESEHLVAFARAAEGGEIAVVAPRFSAALVAGRCEPPLGAAWGDTTLALPSMATWTELFTGRTVEPQERAGRAEVRVGDVLGEFPVALLRPAG